ncbi:family 65 glycosyl hydrolase [Falsiroseomonas bella]|uniref:Family 65 glycosyl hydrolase n=1 Tax=Falsiroseomonas bella TaxID=2184016 RepID=A0A317F9C5_9PROT|nr:glycosyl hydrolase family 65 protein [Falsiroseomonas bella]PWS35023.1 family 65 glycosyl hydrolase [Falsiroseomonas bella]
MLRLRQPPPEDTFPPLPWALEATRFGPELSAWFVGQAETMFALANGHLGIRGMLDEGAPVREPGVYLNGFHELRPITYGERAHGFPRVGQSMLNLPDGTPMRLYVDGEPFLLDRAELLSFSRGLDMRAGLLERRVVWRMPAGCRLALRTIRLVALHDRHLAAIGWELEAEDAAATVMLCSEMALRPPLAVDPDDPRLAEPAASKRVLRPTGHEAAGLRAVLGFATEGSGLLLGCGMDHVVEDASRLSVSPEARCQEERAEILFQAEVAPGRPLRLWKALAYHYDGGDGATAEELRERVGRSLDAARRLGLDGILAEQRRRVARFWERADIEVEDSDPHRQQVIRWNLYQLMQASERVEGHGIGARGLTGRSYEGHYFWDTEIYVLPFLIYTNPAMARSLLAFRHGMLDKARERARELGHRGATFPWRTIDGREASAYYAAGTAQYHINADIAFALRRYVEVSGDATFLRSHGAEMLVETARFWRDLGFFSPRHGGRFCINGVTGPDEYATVVNNNLFTNLMARANLRYAAEVAEAMRRDHPRDFAELVRRTGLEDVEPAGWREAAERMYLPWDERLRIHPQDDSFLDKEPWDFAGTPEDHYPLLLHYHPLNLYRAQVIKQADTVLAMFLLGDHFTPEEKKRNFDYYDPITTHDSSLSVCVQAIVAAEVGYMAKAMEYFRFAAEMDLSDVGGNMRHGAHVASIGGTWMALVQGFGGLRDHGGRISFDPRLPREWRALRFPLAIRGCRLRVELRHDVTTYRLEAGAALTLVHDGTEVQLSAASPVASLPTPKLPPEPVSEFPPAPHPAPPAG